MKKSIKILTLVLALALICGALVVSAFAATKVTGVTGLAHHVYADFDSIDTTGDESAYVFTPNSTKSVEIDGASITTNLPKDGVNVKWTVTACPYTDNQYLYYTIDGAANGPYFYPTSMANPAYDGSNALNDTYVIFDMDIRIDGTMGGAMTITMDERYANYAKSSNTGMMNYPPVITFQNGVLKANATNITFEDIDEWHHYTFVVHYEQQTDELGKYMVRNEYVYVDGVQLSKGIGVSTQDKTNNFFAENNRTLIAPRYIRMNFPNAACSGGIAFDNYSVMTLTEAYDETALKAILTDSSKKFNDPTNNANVWDGTLPFGILAATVNGVNYDNLQKAIDAAEDSAEVVLCANVTENVTVDKNLTIVCGEYTGFEYIQPGDTYQKVDDGDAWVVEEATDVATLNWAGYAIPDTAYGFDATTDMELTLGAGILANAPVKDWQQTVGNDVYALVGWTIDGEEIDETAMITEDMLGETIELEPVISITKPNMKITDANGNVTFYADKTFLELVTTACEKGDGATLTLLQDVRIEKWASVTVNKNITIDLNGHTLGLGIYGDKLNILISVAGNKTLTIKGEQEGSQFIYAAYNSAANVKKFNSFGVFDLNTNSVLAFEGENLLVAVPFLCRIDEPATITFDGGYYTSGNGSDSMAWIYSAGGGTLTMTAENATFFGENNSTLCVYNTRGSVSFDNCVIVGNLQSASTDYSVQGATFTNCYFVGYAQSPGTNTMGSGNYISDKSIIGGYTLDKNIQEYTINFEKTIYYYDVNYALNSEGTDVDYAASMTPTKASVTATFTKYTFDSSKEATVSWYDTDGTTLLGTTKAVPGFEAGAPGIAVADGWVKMIYTQWTNEKGEVSTLVPTDATEYSFTLVEGSAYTYIAGQVPMYVNFDAYMHGYWTAYVPFDLPEGVAYAATNPLVMNGTGRALNNYGFTIDGNKYYSNSIWPTPDQIDTFTMNVSISYVYDGTTLTYTAPVKSIIDYMNYIFDGEYDEDVKTLAADWMRYVVAINVATNKLLGAEYAAMVEEGGKAYGYLTDTTKLAWGEETLTAGNEVWNQYVSSVTYEVIANQSANAACIVITVTDEFTAAGGTNNSFTVNVGSQNEMRNGKITLRVGIAFLNDNAMKITLKLGDIEETIDFSLAAYYNTVKGSCTEAQKAFLANVYAYVQSASKVSGK